MIIVGRGEGVDTRLDEVKRHGVRAGGSGRW